MDGMITHRGLAFLMANSIVVSNWQQWHRDHRSEALPAFRVTTQTMLITEDNIKPLLESLEVYRDSRGSAKRDNKTQRTWLDRFIAELRRLVNFEVVSQNHTEPRVARIPHEEYHEKYVEEIIRLTNQRAKQCAKRPDLERYEVKELQRYLKPVMGLMEEVPENVLRDFRREAEARMLEALSPVSPPAWLGVGSDSTVSVSSFATTHQKQDHQDQVKTGPVRLSANLLDNEIKNGGVKDYARILNEVTSAMVGHSEEAKFKIREMRGVVANRIAQLEPKRIIDIPPVPPLSEEESEECKKRARTLAMWQVGTYWMDNAVVGGPPPRYGVRTQREAMNQHWKLLGDGRKPSSFRNSVFRAWETVIPWAVAKHSWTIENPKHGFPAGTTIPEELEEEITNFLLLSEEEQWAIVNAYRDFGPVPSTAEWEAQNSAKEESEPTTPTPEEEPAQEVKESDELVILKLLHTDLLAVEETL